MTTQQITSANGYTMAVTAIDQLLPILTTRYQQWIDHQVGLWTRTTSVAPDDLTERMEIVTLHRDGQHYRVLKMDCPQSLLATLPYNNFGRIEAAEEIGAKMQEALME